jgi:HAD superfamily hydrolase (TIGR01509 family)
VVDAIHAGKTRHYETLVAGGRLPLRPGMLRLIREAFAANLPVAIATTTTPANIDALLRTHLGQDWRKYFAVIRDGLTDTRKKPAPDVYFSVLNALHVEGHDCLAFEDSQNGLTAALAANIRTLVTPTRYTAMQRFDGAMLVLEHLGDPENPMPQAVPGAEKGWVDIETLRCWHRGMQFEAA